MEQGKIMQPFIPFYREQAAVIDFLSDEQAGQLIKAITKFWLYGEETTIADKRLAMQYQEWKQKIERSGESYEKRVKANRQNGQKGGRPAKPKEETPAEPF